MLFPIADVVVNPFLLLLLGLLVGTLGGFFGVGGGFLVTGGLLVFGVPATFAVGTGLTLIMGSSIINTLKHRRLGNVDFKLGFLMVVGTVPAVFGAEEVIKLMESADITGPAIRYIYVAFLAVLGSFLIYDYRRSHSREQSASGDVSTVKLAHRVQAINIGPSRLWFPGLGWTPTYISLPVSGIERISVFIPIFIGAIIGFFAGLLGAGGGFILMPTLVFILGVPTMVAIGTDLFQIIITGSVGTFVKSLSNSVDPVMVVIMLASASFGSQIGAAATKVVDPTRIRVLFGVTILSGSLAVALKQVSESVSGTDFLSTVASGVLLGVAGAICLLIAGLLVKATLHQTDADSPDGQQKDHQYEEGAGAKRDAAGGDIETRRGDL
ncbi:MAG: hypothetical protein BZY81_05695 [SAR202 cluster bacterium Io17-Chloro-G4]|nr:MAG: hypothetical protein BZY81_05695 [SAR202 cluster bacterium Io17-Chloro-G4]